MSNKNNDTSTFVPRKDAIIAWHFLPDNGLTANDEGKRPVVGKTMKVKPPVVLCSHGYHASINIMDALGFAPGAMVQRVAMWGDVQRGGDKLVASNRTCLSLVDGTRTLHEFACWCAEGALTNERNAGREPDVACWKAIEVKRLWLDSKATDKDLAAAWDAAWDAARDAQARHLSAMIGNLGTA